MIYRTPNSNEIGDLAVSLESSSNFVMKEDIEQLEGGWELRWSSSKAPFLKYSRIIDNYQILDPFSLKGMNLLKPKGVNQIIGSAILANLYKINEKRIGVDFTHAGLLAPKIGNKQIKGLIKFNKLQKGWLDITYLKNNIRICRGDKGTLFVLLKKNNADLFNKFKAFNKGINH